MLQPVARDNLSNQVFSQLRDEILNKGYQPGDCLPPERKLCDMLQVNRSSVREALKRLEQARLIEIRHGGGSVVLDFRKKGGFDLIKDLLMPAGRINPAALRSLLEFRMLLGVEIAYCAALRIRTEELEELEGVVDELESCGKSDMERFQVLDFDFHHSLAYGSENITFILLMNAVKDTYFEYKEFFQVMFIRELEEKAAYRNILEALKRRDAEGSRKCCGELIECGNRAFWDSFQKHNAKARELDYQQRRFA